MDSPPLGNGVIDSTGTPPPSLPTNIPPARHRDVDTPANNRPAAAVDSFFKRMIKKSDAFALGLFFASFGFLYFSLNNPHSGHHFAIALVLKFIVFIVALFLYLCSCCSNPGPKFLKVQVTVLIFCVGLLVLAIFLARARHA